MCLDNYHIWKKEPSKQSIQVADTRYCYDILYIYIFCINWIKVLDMNFREIKIEGKTFWSNVSSLFCKLPIMLINRKKTMKKLFTDIFHCFLDEMRQILKLKLKFKFKFYASSIKNYNSKVEHKSSKKGVQCIVVKKSGSVSLILVKLKNVTSHLSRMQLKGCI